MAEYVYVTEIEGHGQDQILDIFKSYENAKDLIIERANFAIINCEDTMYVEKVYEEDGVRCTYGVYWIDESGDDEDLNNEKYRLYVYRKELK